MCQVLAIDYDICGCVGNLPYYRCADIFYLLDEYRVLVQDYAEPAKQFLHGISAVSHSGFTYFEAARWAVRVYSGKSVPDRSSSTSGEMTDEDRNAL